MSLIHRNFTIRIVNKCRKNVRCKVRGGVKSKRGKLNDRPRDTFSGEAGDEMSVPKRKENGTAPKRVACQSPADRTAKQSTTNQERKVFAYGRRNFYESK